MAGEPGLAVPEWARSGTVYCVFPRNYSGRGLAGVREDMERIAGLGTGMIWLLPVHPIGLEGRKGTLGSPYAIRDDRAVSEELGTREDLRELVEAAHGLGMRVLIDYVANHTANDHVELAENPDWCHRDGDGKPTRRIADWFDIADRRFDQPAMVEYLIESARGWVEDIGVDGFRCDVAGMVPREFWKALRERLDPGGERVFLLGEWQDAELHVCGFHASYDWMLYRALRDVATGSALATEVTHALRAWQENFPRRAVPLRFLENHDEPRAVAIFGRERLAAFAAVAYLSGGLPLVYNGQEIGATRRPSLFDADPIAWDVVDEDVAGVMAEVLGWTREEPWGQGALELLEHDCPGEVVAFSRPGAGKDGVVVANLGRVVERVTLGAPVQVAAVKRGVAAAWDGTGVLELEPGEVWVGEVAR